MVEKGHKILIVDDDPAKTKEIVEALRCCGDSVVDMSRSELLATQADANALMSTEFGYHYREAMAMVADTMGVGKSRRQQPLKSYSAPLPHAPRKRDEAHKAKKKKSHAKTQNRRSKRGF